MFLSELRAENFRIFGEGEKALVLTLKPGLTALVGENDCGKTTIVNALRPVFGTRDQEFFRVAESDFHQPSGGSELRKEIRICCKLSGLTAADQAAFAEFLTYEGPDNARTAVIYIHWKALRLTRTGNGRRFTTVEMHSGKAGDGPTLDAEVRQLLCATYLRPLRDAERAMSSGRGSRFSQILQHTKEIKEHGADYDRVNAPRPNPDDLNVLGIGD